MESALRFVVGDNSLEQTLTVGREQIAQDVKDRLQSYLDIYAAGLIVQQVNIEKTDPPGAVKAAFDDVVAAREDKIRLQNEAERYALTIVPENSRSSRSKNSETQKTIVRKLLLRQKVKLCVLISCLRNIKKRQKLLETGYILMQCKEFYLIQPKLWWMSRVEITCYICH